MTGAPLSNGDVGNADEDLDQTWIHETLTRHTGFEDMEFAWVERHEERWRDERDERDGQAMWARARWVGALNTLDVVLSIRRRQPANTESTGAGGNGG